MRIYPRNVPAVGAHSVDISESRISAMLRDQVPPGEVVRPGFTIPTGDVAMHALVRQRNAFGYGFQFLEMARACGQAGHVARSAKIRSASNSALHRFSPENPSSSEALR